MMSKAKIFLIDDDGKDGKNVQVREEMVETPYESEEILQRLLILEPGLLPGDQINPENPRSWLLIKREMGVPGEVDESDRWSLDHLFLDQDGIPTFVECKRASDPRNRREVVAQMLDYAANGIAYWSMDRLRQLAAETSRNSVSLDDAILRLIDKEEIDQEDKAAEIENYWKQVEANLRAGKVRLVFVADEIPRELRRLVEFLNEKMPDVEVLAVEVKQFVGEGRRVVVPRVIGSTKPPPPSPPERLNRKKFLSKCMPEAAQFFARILDSAEDLARSGKYSIYWGTLSFSIGAHLGNGKRAPFVYGWFPDRFDAYLGALPISEHERSTVRQEWLELKLFQPSGEFTLKATLKGETLNRMPEVYERILSKVNEIVKRAEVSEEVT